VKNLIVNADDLGWSEGVNRGIAEAHRQGLVTSASLLANGKAFESGVAIAESNPELGIGVHLNLSNGAPITAPRDVPSLINAAREFEGGPENLILRIASRSLEVDQVEREWDAQIQKIRAAGIRPTHLDGHKHVQMLPRLFEIAIRLAKKHNVRAIRISHEASKLRALLASGGGQKRSVILKQGVQARGLKLLARDARKMANRAGLLVTDYFCGIAQTGVMTPEGIDALLKNLPDGTTELMCHPGYADGDLSRSPTRLQESRQSELAILTAPQVRKLVAIQGIRLISYHLLGEVA
jgi:chitin disaccharide deacetylase